MMLLKKYAMDKGNIYYNYYYYYYNYNMKIFCKRQVVTHEITCKPLESKIFMFLCPILCFQLL